MSVSRIHSEVTRNGRSVQLRRPNDSKSTSFTTVTVRGIFRWFYTHQVTGSHRQGEREIVFSTTELQQLGFPLPVRDTDSIIDDGVVYAIAGVETRYFKGQPAVVVCKVRG